MGADADIERLSFRGQSSGFIWSFVFGLVPEPLPEDLDALPSKAVSITRYATELAVLSFSRRQVTIAIPAMITAAPTNASRIVVVGEALMLLAAPLPELMPLESELPGS